MYVGIFALENPVLKEKLDNFVLVQRDFYNYFLLTNDKAALRTRQMQARLHWT